MIQFTLSKHSNVSQSKLYAISVDVKNFSKVMPKYFESINVIESTGNEIVADEMIRFFGSTLSVRTKHIIIPPNIHEVHIMSGMARGSSFIERYDEKSIGTSVSITVSVNFNGISKIFSPLGFIIKGKMSKIMDEFLESAANVEDSRYTEEKN